MFICSQLQDPFARKSDGLISRPTTELVEVKMPNSPKSVKVQQLHERITESPSTVPRLERTDGPVWKIGMPGPDPFWIGDWLSPECPASHCSTGKRNPREEDGVLPKIGEEAALRQ
jgi:hypothetical protein